MSEPITIEINEFLPVDSSIVENPIAENPPSENPITTETNDVSSITIEIIESLPNPIVELMKQHSKIALLIGLNYVDSPEIALNNRINGMNNAKQILLNVYGFTEDNILVLIEPTREKVLTKRIWGFLQSRESLTIFQNRLCPRIS